MNKLKGSLAVIGPGLALALTASVANADGYRHGLKDADPCCDSWKGFYVGVHGGYAWKDDKFRDFAFTNPDEYVTGVKSDGFVWGFQTGYNWQRGHVVGGLEVDLSGSNIDGSTSLTREVFVGVFQTVTRTDDVKYLGSVRGRLGITQFGGGCCANFLLYGTAGLAWEKINQTSSTTTTPLLGGTVVQGTTTPADRFGWVAGVGAEARLGGSNWIARVEYLHYHFDGQHTAVFQSGPPPVQNFAEDPGRQTIEMVRGGLSYKF